MGQNAASEIAPELFLHVIQYPIAHRVGLVGQGEVGFKLFLDDAVQRRGFGAAKGSSPEMSIFGEKPSGFLRALVFSLSGPMGISGGCHWMQGLTRCPLRKMS